MGAMAWRLDAVLVGFVQHQELVSSLLTIGLLTAALALPWSLGLFSWHLSSGVVSARRIYPRAIGKDHDPGWFVLMKSLAKVWLLPVCPFGGTCRMTGPTFWFLH